MQVDQVYYTPWCDEDGKVIDDGTVTRLGRARVPVTAADPCYRWFMLNAHRAGRADRGRLERSSRGSPCRAKLRREVLEARHAPGLGAT